MTKLLLFFLFGYVAIQLLRGVLRGLDPGKITRIDDVLVEDPICKARVPRSKAVQLDRDGQTWFFCGARCRDQFQLG